MDIVEIFQFCAGALFAAFFAFTKCFGRIEKDVQFLWKISQASGDTRVFSCSKPFLIRRKDPGVFFGFSQCLKRNWDSGIFLKLLRFPKAVPTAPQKIAVRLALSARPISQPRKVLVVGDRRIENAFEPGPHFLDLAGLNTSHLTPPDLRCQFLLT